MKVSKDNIAKTYKDVLQAIADWKLAGGGGGARGPRTNYEDLLD